MANAPSYWTLKRKSRARVNSQLESVHSGVPVEANEAYKDACTEFQAYVNEEFMDCESSFAEPQEFNSLDSDESSSLDSEDEGNNLENDLATWALEENITHSAVNKLLKILKYHHPSLPVDARTLLGTARSESVGVMEKAGGTYHYFGILNAMKPTLEANKCNLASGVCLELQVNVDGLPIFKSSPTQFWPILGIIRNLPTHEPFEIGLFCGPSKPSLNILRIL